MTIEQLRQLILISHVGSINKASEQAHMSQQNLSASVKKLEEEMGCALFVRSAKGITLTAQGKILKAAAEDMLKRLEEAQKQIEQLLTEAAPVKRICSLNILMTPAISTGLLPSLMRLFADQHPEAKIKIIEKEIAEILTILPQGDALGVVSALEPIVREEGLLYRRLGQQRLYAMMAPDHPLAKQKSVSLKTILKYPLAIYQNSYSSANPICKVLEAHGTPIYHIITNNFPLYHNAIISRQAVGFMTRFTLRSAANSAQAANQLRTLPIKNLPNMELLMCVERDYYAAHQELIENFLDIYTSLI